jgi:hypothetical protein
VGRLALCRAGPPPPPAGRASTTTAPPRPCRSPSTPRATRHRPMGWALARRSPAHEQSDDDHRGREVLPVGRTAGAASARPTRRNCRRRRRAGCRASPG